ncbi:MAG: 30S ribosomal protein S5 [Candidatus Saganbacteria bacterium]|nr:30S ribosomal protein S5 [Candidatus Saganbacteria bacterium]
MAEYKYNTGSEESGIKEKVVQIRRVTKVVKGGKKMSFRAVVIVGDEAGSVGLGIGKANEVASAIRKAVEDGKKNMIKVPIVGGTVPHDCEGKFSSTKTIIRTAPPGKGVIAGGPVRTVLELAGVRNIVAKSIGSSNAINVIRATLDSLLNLKNLEEETALRGIELKVKQIVEG